MGVCGLGASAAVLLLAETKGRPQADSIEELERLYGAAAGPVSGDSGSGGGKSTRGGGEGGGKGGAVYQQLPQNDCEDWGDQDRGGAAAAATTAHAPAIQSSGRAAERNQNAVGNDQGMGAGAALLPANSLPDAARSGLRTILQQWGSFGSNWGDADAAEGGGAGDGGDAAALTRGMGAGGLSRGDSAGRAARLSRFGAAARAADDRAEEVPCIEMGGVAATRG